MQARSEGVSAPFDFRSDAWLYDPAIQGAVEARLAAEYGADAVEVGGAVLSALFAPEADPTSVEEWAERVRAELLDRRAMVAAEAAARARAGASRRGLQPSMPAVAGPAGAPPRAPPRCPCRTRRRGGRASGPGWRGRTATRRTGSRTARTQAHSLLAFGASSPPACARAGRPPGLRSCSRPPLVQPATTLVAVGATVPRHGPPRLATAGHGESRPRYIRAASSAR